MLCIYDCKIETPSTGEVITAQMTLVELYNKINRSIPSIIGSRPDMGTVTWFPVYEQDEPTKLYVVKDPSLEQYREHEALEQMLNSIGLGPHNEILIGDVYCNTKGGLDFSLWKDHGHPEKFQWKMDNLIRDYLTKTQGQNYSTDNVNIEFKRHKVQRYASTVKVSIGPDTFSYKTTDPKDFVRTAELLFS